MLALIRLLYANDSIDVAFTLFKDEVKICKKRIYFISESTNLNTLTKGIKIICKWNVWVVARDE